MAYMQPSEHPDKYIKNTDKKPPLTNTPKPSFTEAVKKGYKIGSKGTMVGKFSRGGENTDIAGGIAGAVGAAVNYFKD